MSAVYTTPADAIRIMGRVLFALILREAGNRYGKLKIGYLWAFLEPMLYVSVLAILFTYVRDLRSGDMPEIQFYITGIMPFFLFRNIVTQTMSCISANYQLLTFPQVQVFDLIVARALLETITYTLVFIILIAAVGLVEIEPVKMGDLLGMLQVLAVIFLLGIGFGAGAAALIPLFPTLQYLITGVVLRPLIFISGIFFTADIIPEGLRYYALLNPLLQLIEQFRSAFFPQFESEYVDWHYLLGFTLVTLFMGLLIQRAMKRHAMRIPV